MSDLDFRLSKSVRPQRYELLIEVDLDAWQFQGNERVDITLDEPTAEVTLHATELNVTSAQALLPDGRSLTSRPAFNEEAETVTLSFDEALPSGSATLDIAFNGEIRDRLRIDKVRRTAQDFPGDVPLVILMVTGRTETRLTTSIKVDPAARDRIKQAAIIPAQNLELFSEG